MNVFVKRNVVRKLNKLSELQYDQRYNDLPDELKMDTMWNVENDLHNEFDVLYDSDRLLQTIQVNKELKVLKLMIKELEDDSSI